MSNYNYLKIDFYGQFNADTIHKLTYPEPFNPMAGTAAQLWLNPITDPRVLRTLFPLAKYGYRVHRDANGTYFSYLTRYERDARQGYVAITVMIGAQYESIINGKAIFNLLNLLKTNVLDTNNITAAAVEQCLIASNMPAISATAPHISAVPSRSQQAFRVYSSNDELHDIFQFPKQQEYDQYGEVFLINKLWCNSSVPGVALLTSPIIKTYSVTCPANVQCDSTTQTGMTLTITYTKPGYAPLTVPVTVNGINNQYVRYQGATITILTPGDLPFKQRMNVRVRVNGYNYSDNSLRATVGGASAHYSSLLGAYTADVNPETLAQADINVDVNIDDPLLERTGKSQHRAKMLQWLAPIIGLLAGAAIAGALTWFLMKDNGDSSNAQAKHGIAAIADSTIMHDINYMNDNKTWHLDSLNDEGYKKLAEEVKKGDVDKLLELTGKLIGDLNNNGIGVGEHLTKIYNIKRETVKHNPDVAKHILMSCYNPSTTTLNIEKVANELSQRINTSVTPQGSPNDNSAPGNNDARDNGSGIAGDHPTLERPSPTPTGGNGFPQDGGARVSRGGTQEHGHPTNNPLSPHPRQFPNGGQNIND